MGIRLFNTRGNTTLMALFVVGVVSSGVYFISNKIVVERKLSAQLRKDIHANLALRSVTDYVKYGIRKGWCFDDKLLPEPPEKCSHNFDNQFSSMRLMMPPSYAKTLQDLGASHPTEFPNLKGKTAVQLMLQSFSIKMDLTNISISQAHPLYRVLTNTRNPLVKGVTIKASRIGNQTLPVNGDEVYLEILTEFTGKDGKPIRTGSEIIDEKGDLTTIGNQFLRETARFVSNPRELNTFTLILPGTIYLGRSFPPEPGHGDLAIPLGSKSDRGIVFNSPVFVNENIFVNKQSDSYTPATFNDVVVLGNGIIKTQDGAPFKINDSLGEKRYWTDLGTFGGFARGIDSDGKRDAGLTTLNGASDATTLNNDIITQCINIIRSQSDPDLTQGSRMVGEPINGNPVSDKLLETTIRYSFSELSTGALNIFVPQLIETDDGGINITDATGGQSLNKPYNQATKDESTIWYSFNPTYDLASGTKLVMWAYMEWGSDKLKIPVLEKTNGDGHNVTISFSPYSKEEVDEAKAKTDAASATLKSKMDELADLETKKPDPIAYPVSYTAWLLTKDGKDYVELTTPTDSKSVSAAQVRKEKIEDEYEQRKKYYDNPGQLELSSVKPNNGFTEKQSVFRNVTVKIINPKNFKRANKTGVTLYGNVDQTSLSSRVIDNFTVEGMEYSAVEHGFSTRPKDSKGNVTNDPNKNALADINNVHYQFAIDTADPDRPMYFSNHGRDWKDNVIDLGQYKPLDPKINYQQRINKCFDSAGGTNLDAFKPASFASADFTKVSPDSWHFAAEDKNVYANEDFTTNIYDFRIRSIRDKCTIQSSVTVFTGFYVCRTLEIQARTSALQMVGTFMVIKDLKIDPSALRAGITWQSMHNQSAVNTMKATNPTGSSILRRTDGGNCSGLYSSSVPFWHPDPGLNILADRIRCSSTFLLQGKGPPRWTSVDPDCGRIGDSTNTQCLKRIRNFNLIQLERIYGL